MLRPSYMSLPVRRFEYGCFILFFLVFAGAAIIRLNSGPEYEFFDLIKPATVLQYSGFLAFAFLLNLSTPFFTRLPKRVLSIMLIFGFFAMMATLFEVFWAFGYWFSNYELMVLRGAPPDSATLDNLTYIPSKELRQAYLYDAFSLNLAAKKNMLYFMIALYSTCFIHSILRAKDNLPPHAFRSN